MLSLALVPFFEVFGLPVTKMLASGISCARPLARRKSESTGLDATRFGYPTRLNLETAVDGFVVQVTD
jgi:hypothetical protein